MGLSIAEPTMGEEEEGRQRAALDIICSLCLAAIVARRDIRGNGAQDPSPFSVKSAGMRTRTVGTARTAAGARGSLQKVLGKDTTYKSGLSARRGFLFFI